MNGVINAGPIGLGDDRLDRAGKDEHSRSRPEHVPCPFLAHHPSQFPGSVKAAFRGPLSTTGLWVVKTIRRHGIRQVPLEFGFCYCGQTLPAVSLSAFNTQFLQPCCIVQRSVRPLALFPRHD